MLRAPTQSPATQPQAAVVTGLTDTTVFVRIPAHSVSARVGPCQMLDTPTPLQVGDNVLVVFLNGSRNRPVIIGKLLG